MKSELNKFKEVSGKYSVILLMSVILLFLTFNLNAQPASELFKKANEAYRTQQYEVAIKKYQELLKTNNYASEIYYNLGNAYYKTGEYASAILNYERAKKIKPDDEDIAYNLKLANMQIVDKIEPVPQVFYEKGWESLLSVSTPDKRSQIAFMFLYVAVILFILYLFVRNYSIKRISFFASLIILFVGLVLMIIAYQQHEFQVNRQQAVIFSSNEYVKGSPEENGKNLFMLHSGTKVEVLDQLQGWKKIRLANGNQGWITADALEEI